MRYDWSDRLDHPRAAAQSVSRADSGSACDGPKLIETESKRVDASIQPFTGYRAMDVLIVERDPMVAEVLADALADVGLTAAITAREDRAIASLGSRWLPRRTCAGLLGASPGID